MKHYETPELVELGDAVELTLGTRPGDNVDQSGGEYWPSIGCCCCCEDPGNPPHQN